MYLPIGVSLLSGSSAGTSASGTSSGDDMLAPVGIGGLGTESLDATLTDDFAALLTGLYTGSTAPAADTVAPVIEEETDPEEEGSAEETFVFADWSDMNPQLVPLVTEISSAPAAPATAPPPSQMTDPSIAPIVVQPAAPKAVQPVTTDTMPDGPQNVRGESSLQPPTSSPESDVEVPIEPSALGEFGSEMPSKVEAQDASTLKPLVQLTQNADGSDSSQTITPSATESSPEEIQPVAEKIAPVVDDPLSRVKPEVQNASTGESRSPESPIVSGYNPHEIKPVQVTRDVQFKDVKELPVDGSAVKATAPTAIESDMTVTVVAKPPVESNSDREDQESSGQQELASDSFESAKSDFGADIRSADRSAASQPQVSTTKPVDDVQVVWQIVDAMKVANDDPQIAHPKIEVELDPPELGRVSIELADTERGLTARITVQRESTAHLVEQQMATIRQSLDQAGLHVRDFQLSHQGSFAGRNAFGSGGQQDMARDQDGSNRRQRPEPELSLASGLLASPKWRSAGRVDLRL